MHVDSLGSGGAQRQIVTLGVALARRGHTVAFNTYYPLDHFQGVLDEAGIEVRMRAKSGRFSIGPVRNLIAHAREMKADAIVAFLRTPAVHAELAGLILRRCRIVVSERFVLPGGRLSRALWLLQQLHRLADAVTINSSHAARGMIDRFPWMARKATVIRNGYDLSPLSDGPDRTEDRLRLLALGSIDPRKDPLTLARALRICRQDMEIPVRVDWAGAPKIVGGICKAQVATDAFLREHGLQDHWTWLGARKDVLPLIDARDALVHPSLSEGFANAIAEAMARARPVLIGRTGDQPDVIRESGGGLLFDTGDPDSIAAAIASLYGMRDTDRAGMGRKARQYAEDFLSVDAMTDAYETLLQGLTGKT